MSENTSFENNGSTDELDRILGRSAADVIEPEVVAVPETEDSQIAPTKAELKAQKKAARKEKRKQQTGISFTWALILLLLTNIAWMGYIKFVDAPRWQATIDEYKVALEEKDETIRRIQVVYQEREKDFEKRLTEAEENYKELNERLQKAIDKYNKYFGKDDPVE